jgi:hypothetical protein
MTDKAISPLRRRMIEDMTIRKLSPKTQQDYVQRVKNFATFLGRSPDTANFEDVRRYQLHLAESGAGVPTLNQSVSTLRFFFRITLGRADIVTTFMGPASANAHITGSRDLACATKCRERPYARRQLNERDRGPRFLR